MQKRTSKVKTREDLEIIAFNIKSLLGLIILTTIAVFVIFLNILIVPFDLARKPIRNFVYKHYKTSV